MVHSVRDYKNTSSTKCREGLVKLLTPRCHFRSFVAAFNSASWFHYSDSIAAYVLWGDMADAPPEGCHVAHLEASPELGPSFHPLSLPTLNADFCSRFHNQFPRAPHVLLGNEAEGPPTEAVMLTEPQRLNAKKGLTCKHPCLAASLPFKTPFPAHHGGFRLADEKKMTDQSQFSPSETAFGDGKCGSSQLREKKLTDQNQNWQF